MKIVTASNGKKTIKMSRKEWMEIGKKAGWKIKSQTTNYCAELYRVESLLAQEMEELSQRISTLSKMSNEPYQNQQEVANYILELVNNKIVQEIGIFAAAINQISKDQSDLNIAKRLYDTVNKLLKGSSRIPLLEKKKLVLFESAPSGVNELLAIVNEVNRVIEKAKKLCSSMKIATASNGKKIVKMSKNEWMEIGKKAGWTPIDPSEITDEDVGPIYSPEDEESIFGKDEGGGNSFAYKDGFRCGIKSKTDKIICIEDNPYRADSEKFEFWRKGFIIGQS